MKKIKDNSWWVAILIALIIALFPEKFSSVGQAIITHWLELSIIIIIILLVFVLHLLMKMRVLSEKAHKE